MIHANIGAHRRYHGVRLSHREETQEPYSTTVMFLSHWDEFRYSDLPPVTVTYGCGSAPDFDRLPL